jgi:hypothetical protein
MTELMQSLVTMNIMLCVTFCSFPIAIVDVDDRGAHTVYRHDKHHAVVDAPFISSNLCRLFVVYNVPLALQRDPLLQHPCNPHWPLILTRTLAPNVALSRCIRWRMTLGTRRMDCHAPTACFLSNQNRDLLLLTGDF